MNPSTKRAILTVGSLLAVLLVAALALPAVGRIIQSTAQEAHDLPAELAHLSVHGEVGDIRVRAAGPGEEPGAEATIRSGLGSTRVVAEVVGGDRAELSDTCQSHWWDNCSVEWEVVVPADTEVLVGSDVGDVTVSNISGSLTVTSSVGEISATGISSPAVQVRSSVGDVALDLAAAPDQVTVTSSTGDVSVRVPDDGGSYRVEIDTAIGSVTNQVGSDPSGRRLIDLRTSVGDITLRRG